ncbi:hypothetical protein AXW67_11765 [Bradyrhizobium neotropicale]|uniref:Uncharacterized protein n=2 Tax=Bradyrhizobium neotropicale TaxID=1497615 RepID=A0A176Z7S7_9BRAD|nr:hypothetical protein AXW67_11765 [Bradyrhizobium neotropicale]
MPQIWMTYDELGTLCGCDAMEAREYAKHLSLDRRRSRDGATRVKLNHTLMMQFFATVREAEPDLDGAIAALRETHRRMAEPLALEAAYERRGTV